MSGTSMFVRESAQKAGEQGTLNRKGEVGLHGARGAVFDV